MLCEYSHTKSQSLAQIRTIMAEIQHFSRELYFCWRTLYMLYKQACNKLGDKSNQWNLSLSVWQH